MIVSIIADDKTITVDGKGLNCDFNMDSNTWAIQWGGSSGHTEFRDGTPNEEFTEVSVIQGYLDAYEAKKSSDAAKQVEVEPTYEQLRAVNYPSLEEQFDMQYHDQVEGTTTWLDAVSAVKETYPKT